MTIQRPRLSPRIAGFPELVRETNRSLAELASSVDGALAALSLGGAQLLSVPQGEAAAGFAFVGTRRIYSAPSAIDPATFDIRVFSAGETIVRHGLGRAPLGRFVAGQRSAGTLIDLDVSTLTPALDPAAFVAFVSTITALYRIVVF